MRPEKMNNYTFPIFSNMLRNVCFNISDSDPTLLCLSRRELVDGCRLWTQEGIHLLVSHCFMKTTDIVWVSASSLQVMSCNKINFSIIHLSVSSMNKRDIVNLNKTFNDHFLLVYTKLFVQIRGQVKTISYNLVPGKCKSTFQIHQNKNHAVHYILYS